MVNESQHTGPANQSETITYFWGSDILEKGSQAAVQMTMETEAHNKSKIYEQ